ncbi:unnamed protein product [Leuciscus chuanchicus]
MNELSRTSVCLLNSDIETERGEEEEERATSDKQSCCEIGEWRDIQLEESQCVRLRTDVSGVTAGPLPLRRPTTASHHTAHSVSGLNVCRRDDWDNLQMTTYCKKSMAQLRFSEKTKAYNETRNK